MRAFRFLRLRFPEMSALILVLVASACGIIRPDPITIDWHVARQMIDGFGAATSDDPISISKGTIKFFFASEGPGIGLSFIRVKIYPDLAACAEDNSSAKDCLQNASGPTLTLGALQNLQAASSLGARVWAAEWTPPAAIKSGKSHNGGSLIGSPDSYRLLASIQAAFVSLLAKRYGIAVFAVSAQNEPDFVTTSYESAKWTAEQIHDYVPYLRAALDSGGFDSTKIVIAEQSTWDFKLASLAMSDPAVAGKVGILAAHNYDQFSPRIPPTFPNFTTQSVWQTESSTNDPYDGGIDNALKWAERIDGFLSAGQVNAWHYWHLSAVPSQYKDNEALTDSQGNLAVRAYAIGHWSKFVRPGWHAVRVVNKGRLLVTAFQNSSGSKSAIIVVNLNRSAATRPTFATGSAMQAITAWITSSSQLLAPQPPLYVTGGTFSYNIPARSIVTFEGGASTP